MEVCGIVPAFLHLDRRHMSQQWSLLYFDYEATELRMEASKRCRSPIHGQPNAVH